MQVLKVDVDPTELRKKKNDFQRMLGSILKSVCKLQTNSQGVVEIDVEDVMVSIVRITFIKKIHNDLKQRKVKIYIHKFLNIK